MADRMADRWIDQLNRLYWTIVKSPDIPVAKLDKANEVICEAIEKLRPLAHRSLCARCMSDEPEIRKTCTANCEEHERAITPIEGQ